MSASNLLSHCPSPPRYACFLLSDAQANLLGVGRCSVALNALAANMDEVGSSHVVVPSILSGLLSLRGTE
jgi:hypothetical protein